MKHVKRGLLENPLFSWMFFPFAHFDRDLPASHVDYRRVTWFMSDMSTVPWDPKPIYNRVGLVGHDMGNFEPPESCPRRLWTNHC